MKYSMQDGVKKFYPTPEECKVNNTVHCTEDGCTSVFISESNLNLHLVKTHRKSYLLTKSNSFIKQYFCPELGCLYNSGKYFKELKILRAHYMMKHSSEQFICITCKKVFPLQKVLSHHTEYCGVSFTCLQCPASYAMYESLQTHGRRKKHVVPTKSYYKLQKSVPKNDSILQTSNYPILPKTSFVIIMAPNMLLDKFSQESQTLINTPEYKSKTTQVNKQFESINSQHTQTGVRNNYLTVETQTSGDYYNCSRKNSVFENSLTQKNSRTQTDLVEFKNSSCNTSFNGDYLSVKHDIKTNNSSTQTGDTCPNNYSSSTHTHDSIYTDTSDLVKDDLNMNSFEFNCNMETQTDFIFDDVMFGCDYMSNMYTQTCDEILSDLGFSDIQTQTVFDDLLKSVESQTVMSQKKQDGDRDTMHMETQTDMEFRQMLEVINS